MEIKIERWNTTQHRADAQINGTCCYFYHPRVFMSWVWRAKTDTWVWSDCPQPWAYLHAPRAMVSTILIQKPVTSIDFFLHVSLCAKHLIFIISGGPLNRPVRLALFPFHRWGHKYRERWPVPGHKTGKWQGWNKPLCLTRETLLP